MTKASTGGTAVAGGAIRARDLGKKYKCYPGRWQRLAEWATAGSYAGHEEIWALRGVTFEVAPGEAVGIIGQNGAGKSTLLKLIVGTTQLTEGVFSVDGQVAALLELGMGFHPEFNGRQNALMTLQMMGYDEQSATVLLPEIEAFSELGSFMEQPLRTYSSGMQVRLGFAVATVRRPDILIVDEALSVGDAYFQHKCIRRIREIKEAGTTMLFVSHDPIAVKTLCDRAILLDQGRVIEQGPAEAVLDLYNAMIAEREKAADSYRATIRQSEIDDTGRIATRSGDGKARLVDVAMTDRAGRSTQSFAAGEPAQIRCCLEFADDLPAYAIGVLIRDRLGNDVFGSNTTHLGLKPVPARSGERVEAVFDIELNLGFGQYSLTVAAHSPSGHLDQNHDWIDNALAFQIIPGDAERFAGVAKLPISAKLELLEKKG